MRDDNDTETILRCRCADCATARQRLCQSGQLKIVLSDLFDEEQSIEKVQGLFCRRKSQADVVKVEEGAECLCPDCELATGEGGYFCNGMEAQGS